LLLRFLIAALAALLGLGTQSILVLGPSGHAREKAHAEVAHHQRWWIQLCDDDLISVVHALD
jgi:hypothetical protein